MEATATPTSLYDELPNAIPVPCTDRCPRTTAFFLTGRGDHDLIVAMYHDQGHAPVKVLGIEEGTNITVGLAVIRTSVDHGTAFDIAGMGAVDVRSMIEALRQAAEMSAAHPGQPAPEAGPPY
jgi:4-hydroxy-L-threonine phosphate dehydrogenase PdxA